LTCSEIKQEISQWDGKSADTINAIFSCYSQQSEFIPEIIVLIEHESYQKGATWLLKKYFETGEALAQDQITRIYKLLPLIQHWESKLHILQCIPYMPVLKSEKKILEAFLRKCMLDYNKFVRAWTYNGFYELSLQYPEYQQETQQFFEMAMRDEAASVKARIRNIMKKGF